MNDRPERYDLAVIGAGPAGFAAAMRAHDLDKRVLLIERGPVGGAGIHDGALSSKTLWHLSNDYANACRTDRGFAASGVEVSYRNVMDTVKTAVSERRAIFEQQLAALAIPSENARGVVHVLRGTARFESPHELEVERPDGTFVSVHADNILIATGSRPRVPEGVEIDGHFIVSSDHIEHLERFPESLVVVGAGVIGCEYATIFGNFGKTRLALIDRQRRILPSEDEDVAAVVAEGFEQMGVTIHRESKLQSLRVVDGMVEYVLCDPSGVCAPLRVERALVSVGRVPNTDGLRLERAGVKTDPQGGIIVEGTRSTVSHIYAAGDSTLDVALANVAELEGRHAVERMFGEKPPPIRYDALSTIMFLSPEVAAVGLNEQQAKRASIAYRAGVVSNKLVSRNIAMRNTRGFLKLLAAREDPGRILGLRVVGPQASATIQGVAFLIEQGASLVEIDQCVHPHPAVTEGVQECARLLLGRSVHKPSVFGAELLRCVYG
jgi:dihydrolipoamide dehydrogenase